MQEEETQIFEKSREETQQQQQPQRKTLIHTPNTVAHIVNELRKVIVGQDEVIEKFSSPFSPKVTRCSKAFRHGEDFDRKNAGANRRREVFAHSVYARSDAVRHYRNERFNMQSSEFSLRPDRSLLTFCWRTKSIARRRKRKPRCSKRWKSGRRRSMANAISFRRCSPFWRRKSDRIRGNLSLCLKRSLIDFC